MEWEWAEQLGYAIGGLVLLVGQVVGIVSGQRSTRALRGHIEERSLDASEVKILREWAGRVSEIGELRATLNRLSTALEETGFDRSEVRRIRAFFFRTDGKDPEIHELRNQIAPLALMVPRLDERMTAVERELDAKLDRMEQRVIGQLQASERRVGEMTQQSGEQTVEMVGKAVKEITDWLGTLQASGIRGLTPPEGSLLSKPHDKAGE